MEFNLEQIDTLLSTTRAVRRRLDFTREIPDAVLLRCIDLAEQAPSGGNVASRRWLVIRDPDTKARLAALYRAAGGQGLIETAERLHGSGHARARVVTSAAYLAQHLERVPVLVLVTIWGTHDGSGRPGLFDSVLQAAWGFCLALRARGLGSTWTTLHLGRAYEVAALLGIPDGVTQVVLLPVAYTRGTDFTPAPRRPASAITWFDRWGDTNAHPRDGRSLLAAGPGVTVEVDIAATPTRVWEFVRDINLPARFSTEFLGATWIDTEGPRVGAAFVGRNRQEEGREWETTSYIVAWERPRVLAWNVSDPAQPSAQWRFELEPLGSGTRLRQHVTMGPGMSGTARAMAQHPEHAQQILARRRDQLRRNMERTTHGIKQLAESHAEGKDA
jgi:nitroreductase